MPPMIEATGAPRPKNPIPRMMQAVNNKNKKDESSGKHLGKDKKNKY